mgnify:CR=1 FL=1
MDIKYIIKIGNSQRMPKVLTQEENKAFINILDKLVLNDIFIDLTYEKLPNSHPSPIACPEKLEKKR